MRAPIPGPLRCHQRREPLSDRLFEFPLASPTTSSSRFLFAPSLVHLVDNEGRDDNRTPQHTSAMVTLIVGTLIVYITGATLPGSQWRPAEKDQLYSTGVSSSAEASGFEKSSFSFAAIHMRHTTLGAKREPQGRAKPPWACVVTDHARNLFTPAIKRTIVGGTKHG
jgi:hypothetical protein